MQVDVATPSMEWFPAEFEQALRVGAFTTEVWGVCYNGGLDEDQTHYVDMTFETSGERSILIGRTCLTSAQMGNGPG
ncbi:hypothetical protein Pen01_40870 [Phytomonospora endophytica]|nr:hypothetical protein Pen01_40870 [Phytomonospora endophytica]